MPVDLNCAFGPKESQLRGVRFFVVFVWLSVDEAKTEMAQQRFMNYNQGSILYTKYDMK